MKATHHRHIERLSCVIALVLAAAVIPEIAEAKALFLCAEHHSRQFDAWNVNPDGTVTKQATYGLSYATDPAGIAIDTVDPHTGTIIFITSEFSSGIEIVEVPPVGTPNYLGRSSGPSNLAGIDVDDVNDIVYVVRRSTNRLYVYDWDPLAETLTQTALIYLPGCTNAFGLALDETQDILWIADTGAGVARAYDIHTWTELAGVSFRPSHKPVDITVDRGRQLVYTVSMSAGASVPGGTGSYLISQFDLATRIERTVSMGHQGVGIAVDEVSGFVYVTGSPAGSPDDTLSVWDPSTDPFSRIQETGDIGNPAGIAVANVIVNPLNLAKNDTVVGYGINIGQTFTYEITCDNIANPVLDVTGVTILDTLPVELDYVSSTVGGVPQPDSVYDPVTHTVLWDIGTIPAGEVGPLVELVVRVNENAVGGTTIYNFCTIDGNEIPPTTVIGEDPDAPPGEEPGSYVRPCVDVTAKIAENKYGMRYNRRTGVQTFYMTLTNISADLVAAPLILVVEDISPGTVVLLNGDGATSSGKPYFAVDVGPDGVLSPGETSAAILWQVSNPTRARWSYSISVWSGGTP